MAEPLDPNSTQGVLQRLLQSAADPARRQQLEAQRNEAQQRYLGVLNEPLPDAGPVQRMIGDYLSSQQANPNRGFWNLAGAVGGEAGRTEKARQNQLLRRQQAAEQEAKMAGDALKESDNLAARLAISKSLGGGGGGLGKWVQAKDDAGNLIFYNNATFETKTIPASRSKQFDQVQRQVFDKLTEERDPDALSKSIDFAYSVIGSSPQGVTLPGTEMPTQPVSKAGTQPPGALVPPQPQAQPQPQSPSPPSVPTVNLSMPKGIKPEVETRIVEQLRTAQAMALNPETRDQGIAQLQFLQSQYPQTAQSALQPDPARSQVQYKDPRMMGFQSKYGETEGSATAKERTELSQAYQANTALQGQLDALEKLYANPNIPEGKLGPLLQDIRSGLQTLGVEVDPSVGPADLANALAQKMVLGIRTADGVNLLPGAISNFEVQLLQSMGPTLSLTGEGRKSLVKYMKEVAKSQVRLSEEATKFAKENKNQLTPEWLERKERVIKQEQARRAAFLRNLQEKSGGQP